MFEANFVSMVGWVCLSERCMWHVSVLSVLVDGAFLMLFPSTVLASIDITVYRNIIIITRNRNLVVVVVLCHFQSLKLYNAML